MKANLKYISNDLQSLINELYSRNILHWFDKDSFLPHYQAEAVGLNEETLKLEVKQWEKQYKDLQNEQLKMERRLVQLNDQNLKLTEVIILSTEHEARKISCELTC